MAACADLPSLLEAIDAHAPDLVLTDIRMPPTHTDEGVRVANALRETRPSVGVIVLSQYAEPAYALALFERDSDRRGYLFKERVHDASQLVAAIETVATGGSVVDPRVVEVVIAARSRDLASPLNELLGEASSSLRSSYRWTRRDSASERAGSLASELPVRPATVDVMPPLAAPAIGIPARTDE